MPDLAKNKAAFLELPKPKAIIFDWDNTLIDSWPLIQNAIDTTMIAMGKDPWGYDKVRANIHKSMRESFPQIFGDKWQEAGEIYKNSYRENHLEKIKLLPNSLKLINFLKTQEILQFVVSNKIGITLRKEVKKLGLEDHFFSVIGAMDAKADKPNKDPVELALKGSGLDPKKDIIWFVGDTIADVKCAYNASCLPVVFSDVKDQVSQTIDTDQLLGKDYNNKILPIYFDHNQVIEKMEK